MKYFDPVKNQLIYTYKKPTSEFWDLSWEKKIKKRLEILKKESRTTYVSRIIKHYLKPKNGVILEGGCGIGTHVAALVNNGYKCIGIDTAEKTVKILNKYVPELDIRIGNVKKLEFENNYFSGYWSLGVIEHFEEGYQQSAKEMFRVIKKGGYLFLGVPYMCPLRRLKSKLRRYKLLNEQKIEDFYQFALNSKNVIDDFERIGFKIVKTFLFSGGSGLKQEINATKTIGKLFQILYDYNVKNKLIIYFRNALSLLLSPISSHIKLFVFKKIM